MLDKRQLTPTSDRFLLTDLTIVQWDSLMRSTVFEGAFSALDPDQGYAIELRSESIFPSPFPPEGRYGIDPAAIGIATASCIISRNSRLIAFLGPGSSPSLAKFT
jgi:hypothetical protein